jgi:hypothetical protein
MLPSTILHGYYYRYKVRLLKAGILTKAKRIQADPQESVVKAANQRQVYCITKRKFFAMATKAEMEQDLDFSSAQDQHDKDEMHRILQCRLR